MRSMSMPHTDHSAYISALRGEHSNLADLCADLLEMHDRTGISLDHWISATEVITAVLDGMGIDFVMAPNHV